MKYRTISFVKLFLLIYCVGLASCRDKQKIDHIKLTKEQLSWTIVPVIDDNLIAQLYDEPVPAFLQAAAYAYAVSRVCDIDVPLDVRMDQMTGISEYLIRKHYAEGGSYGEKIDGLPLGYSWALRNTKLINRDGTAVKHDAARLCTPKVHSDLLGDLVLIGKGELEKVDFLIPYLDD